MNKRKTQIVVMMVLGIFLTLTALAAAANYKPDGDERKGKYLYRKNCLSCHDGSKAKELYANTKTQAQWKSSFKRHERFECKKQWEKRSKQDLIDIFTYLYKHAYDSPQPAKCG